MPGDLRNNTFFAITGLLGSAGGNQMMSIFGALAMITAHPGTGRLTLGAGKGYDTAEFVEGCVA